MYRGLLSAALKTKGLAETDGCFELSVGNPDKGQLPLEEIKRRVSQFVEQGLPLVVTQVLTGPLTALKLPLLDSGACLLQ